MSKHTPGPWKVVGTEIADSKGWFVASLEYTAASRLRSPSGARDAANAQLIADAPQLLAERDELLAMLNRVMGYGIPLVPGFQREIDETMQAAMALTRRFK